MSQSLSVAALALSIISITWNVLLTHLRSPRITVEVRRHKVHLPDASVNSTVVLAVINHGTEAMTIRNVGLRAGDHSWELDFEECQRDGGPLPNGLRPLPIRIEGHDCKIWEYSDDQFSCVNGSAEIWGYADRYRTLRFQLWAWANQDKRAHKRAVSYRPALLELSPVPQSLDTPIANSHVMLNPSTGPSPQGG